MAKLHKHLIVHAEIDNPPVKKDEKMVAKWMTDIVHSMGMEVLRKASAAYCEQEGNRGMTADVLITTSHMVLHTWDECEQPFIEFDIYTCSELDPEMAFKALEVFGAKNISYKFLDRYNGLTDLTPKDSFVARLKRLIGKIISA
jgi:S-adenosylmethionine/arginine decarboxylase-like enzyme